MTEHSRSLDAPIAVEATRRILIEHARRKLAAKRESENVRSALDPDLLPARSDAKFDIMAVGQALTRFGTIDPNAAKLAHLQSGEEA